MSDVRLEPIDERNVKAVFELRVAPGQERFGFQPTGELDDDEIVARLTL